MSYCETCSTEYENCKIYCKICGSKLVTIKAEDENLSSTSLDNQRSDCDQENERENAFNPPVIETEKVINDISDNSREPLTVQSTPSIVAINETSSPLDYSVIARIEAINEISSPLDYSAIARNDYDTTSPVVSEPINDSHSDKNLKEDLPASDIHDICKEESLQTLSLSDQANTSKSNPESSSATNTSLRIPFSKSIRTAITEKLHRVSVIKPLVIVMLSILLIGIGYWIYIKYLPVNILSLKTKGPTSIKQQQVVTLQSQAPNQVFETIKKANLTKDINLFMSCYSPKFKLLDSKKRDTLTNWNQYDYNALNYDIKGLTIHKDKASGIVEWIFSVQTKDTKKTFSKSILYNVVLEKTSDGTWKIVFLEKL